MSPPPKDESASPAPSILLLNLSLLPDNDRGISSYGQTVEGLNINAPLGPLYLAGTLKAAGFRARVKDQRVEPFDAPGLAREILRDGYDSVGFYCCDYRLLEDKVAAYIRRIHQEAPIPVIVGGPPFDHDRILRAGANAVCRGEGEKTILDWMDYVAARKRLEDVRGIAYRNGSGRLSISEEQPWIRDLDSIPFPDRQHPRRYRILGNPNCRHPVLETVASRGCPYHCAFCASPEFWGRRIRRRSPENVIAELADLKTTHNARYFHFRDDIFGSSLPWVDRFADLYKSERIDTPWSCYLHPLSFGRKQEAYLRRLSSIGCNLVCIGLQTVDPAILAAIDRRKEETAAFARQVRIARECGILTFASVIYGLPGERRQTMRATADFLKANRPDILVILPLQRMRASALAARYPEGPVCELSDREIDREIRKSTRSFYLRPLPMARFILYILKHNPRWFLEVLRYLPVGLKFFQILPRKANW